MPMLSIIVPIYKVERFLPKCIKSILNQSFCDFELILVNDGSPDNCMKICNQYAAQDSRIKVIYQNNKGVSAARNLGLENAKGEYVTFVDADDYIEYEYYNTIINYLQRTACDMGMVGYCIEDESGKKSFTTTDNGSIVIDKTNALDKIFTNQFHGSCWNKIFKMEIIQRNELRFQEDIFYCEDLFFNCEYLDCLEENKNVVICDTRSLYHYVKHGQGVTEQKVSKKAITRLDAIDRMLSLKNIHNRKNIWENLVCSYVENSAYYLAVCEKMLSNKQVLTIKKKARKYYPIYMVCAVKKRKIKEMISTLLKIFK